MTVKETEEDTSEETVQYIDILKECAKKYIGLLLFSLVLIFLPTYLMSSTWNTYKKDTEVLGKGKLTQATISKKEKITKDDITNYQLLYSFETKDKKTVKGADTISKREWDKIKKGDSIQVIYELKPPYKNFPRKGGGLTSPTFIKIISVFLFFFIGLGLMTLYSFFINLVSFSYKVINFGIETTATISEIDDIKILYYEYEDESGGRHKDKTKYLNTEAFKGWSVGDKAKIYYDPESPSKNVFFAKNWRDYI